MQTPQHRHRRGFTLVEMLIVVTITGLMFITITAMMIVTLRIWRRDNSFSEAFPPAYSVITRINHELKNAYYVSVANDHSTIVFRIPRTDNTGADIVPFQLLQEITYYRANTTGTMGTTGTTLWRKNFNAVTNQTTYMAVAQNVTSLTFNCDATQSGRVFAVYSTAVTVLGKEQSTQYSSSFSTAVAIRNPLSTN